MMRIVIDTDVIRADARRTEAEYEASFDVINHSDSLCRTWTYRFEVLRRQVQAAAAALRMVEDDAGEYEQWDDRAGDVNSNLLAALNFDAVAVACNRCIGYLETRERELRHMNDTQEA